MTQLPIHDALAPLISALRDTGRAVLQAPPGAGKTTVVPLAMLEANLTKGRILMLEPRRLAARAAAERMAQTLGETAGQTVGYRVRGESKTSQFTRIEVVTEGILTRMIQSDPELSGIGAVIFDEFHERSLNADLGLALCLEICDALRDDLILLAMSATLDAEPVATLMGNAPMIASKGRAYPVETRWLDKPLPKNTRLEEATARLITQAVNETDGGVLVFLPGEGEIRRTQSMLKLPDDCTVHPLFGAMPFKDQQAAIRPAQSGRKVVLATSIAETSLTIQGVRVVVDAGRARRARFDPGSGMSRLVTERVTRAEATQRQGRAGRVAEGICYRLWTKGEEGALLPFPPAEIEAADLTGLALELALWGAAPTDLALLTQPNLGSFAEAQSVLHMLGALDGENRITAHGKAIAKLPLHPRLAHMLATAGSQAAPMAALLTARDP
ncbi:MAG: ATP-dependent helicase HrpB, partial [Pseudomonadota bacterium]|nr:ATP-dependent helicase HrpB [Pseudomonadota bacterium]